MLMHGVSGSSLQVPHPWSIPVPTVMPVELVGVSGAKQPSRALENLRSAG